MTDTTHDQIRELAAEQDRIDEAYSLMSVHKLREMAKLVVPNAAALLYEDDDENGWLFRGVLTSDGTIYEQPRALPEQTGLSPIGDLLAPTSPALEENLEYRRHQFGTLRGAHVFLVDEWAHLPMMPSLDDEVTAIAHSMPEQRRPGEATDVGDTVVFAFDTSNAGATAPQAPAPGPGEILVTRDGDVQVLDPAAFAAAVRD